MTQVDFPPPRYCFCQNPTSGRSSCRFGQCLSGQPIAGVSGLQVDSALQGGAPRRSGTPRSQDPGRGAGGPVPTRPQDPGSGAGGPVPTRASASPLRTLSSTWGKQAEKPPKGLSWGAARSPRMSSARGPGREAPSLYRVSGSAAPCWPSDFK